MEEQYGNPEDMRGKVPKGAGRIQKAKVIDRTNEIKNLLKAVRLRLAPLNEYMSKIREQDFDVYDEIFKLNEDFDDLYDHFEENKGRKKLREKDFRYIKRDLKKLKYVSFHHFKGRYMQIAMEIAALGISFAY